MKHYFCKTDSIDHKYINPNLQMTNTQWIYYPIGGGLFLVHRRKQNRLRGLFGDDKYCLLGIYDLGKNPKNDKLFNFENHLVFTLDREVDQYDFARYKKMRVSRTVGTNVYTNRCGTIVTNLYTGQGILPISYVSVPENKNIKRYSDVFIEDNENKGYTAVFTAKI